MEIWHSVEAVGYRDAVVTLGFFDGVHLGHQKLLGQVLSKGRELGCPTIAVTMWPHPRIVLGKDPGRLRLINSLDYKCELLGGVGLDGVVVLDFTLEVAVLSPTEFLERYLYDGLSPRHVVMGYDHHYGHRGQGDFALLATYAREHGFTASRCEAYCVDGVELSSTVVRGAIDAGDMVQARAWMGRDFGFYGRVEAGRQIGRSMGFPTANIVPLEGWQQLPGHGVYRGYCCLGGMAGGAWYEALINVGTRPTVDNGGETVVEAYLLDFDGSLYGDVIQVFFVEKLRNEHRFSTLEALREQIARDVASVRDSNIKK